MKNNFFLRVFTFFLVLKCIFPAMSFANEGGFTTRQWITSFYVAYWGRAADPSGLNYWIGEVNRGAATISGVAENFALSPEAKAMYPYFNAPHLASHEDRVNFMQAVYRNMFNREVSANDPGLAYWVGELHRGSATPGLVIGHMINAAVQSNSIELLTIYNKTEVASRFTNTISDLGIAWDHNYHNRQSQIAISLTRDDIASVYTAFSSIDFILKTNPSQKLPILLHASIHANSPVGPETNFLRIGGTYYGVAIVENELYDLAHVHHYYFYENERDARDSITTPLQRQAQRQESYILPVNVIGPSGNWLIAVQFSTYDGRYSNVFWLGATVY